MHVEWVVEGRLCRVVVPQQLTDEMLDAYDEQMIRFLDSASGKVNVMVDVGEMAALPNVRKWLGMKNKKHPNFGLTLIVGLEHRPIIRFFASVVSQTANLPFKGFATQAAAMEYLKETQAI